MPNDNLIWAGLHAIAAKRFDRDLLVAGETPMGFRISSIGVGPFKTKVAGRLIVSPNQSRTNQIKPKMDELVAAVLYQIAATKRTRACDLLVSEGLESDAVTQALAAQLIQRLTTVATQPIRGSIAFQAD